MLWTVIHAAMTPGQPSSTPRRSTRSRTRYAGSDRNVPSSLGFLPRSNACRAHRSIVAAGLLLVMGDAGVAVVNERGRSGGGCGSRAPVAGARAPGRASTPRGPSGSSARCGRARTGGSGSSCDRSSACGARAAGRRRAPAAPAARRGTCRCSSSLIHSSASSIRIHSCVASSSARCRVGPKPSHSRSMHGRAVRRRHRRGAVGAARVDDDLLGREGDAVEAAADVRLLVPGEDDQRERQHAVGCLIHGGSRRGGGGEHRQAPRTRPTVHPAQTRPRDRGRLRALGAITSHCHARPLAGAACGFATGHGSIPRPHRVTRRCGRAAGSRRRPSTCSRAWSTARRA